MTQNFWKSNERLDITSKELTKNNVKILGNLWRKLCTNFKQYDKTFIKVLQNWNQTA